MDHFCCSAYICFLVYYALMTPDLSVQYEPPPDCGDGRCRDMFWDSIYIIVIPGGVLFLTVLIISILMCCSSCKRRRKEPPVDDTLMMRYNSIRRMSASLRQLSHNRDTPLLSSREARARRTASLNLDRDQRYQHRHHGTESAPGTLQRDRDRRHRHHQDRHSELLPPGYRTSPGYQSVGEINLGSGVEYSDIQPSPVTPTATDRQDERLIDS